MRFISFCRVAVVHEPSENWRRRICSVVGDGQKKRNTCELNTCCRGVILSTFNCLPALPLHHSMISSFVPPKNIQHSRARVLIIVRLLPPLKFFKYTQLFGIGRKKNVNEFRSNYHHLMFGVEKYVSRQKSELVIISRVVRVHVLSILRPIRFWVKVKANTACKTFWGRAMKRSALQRKSIRRRKKIKEFTSFSETFFCFIFSSLTLRSLFFYFIRVTFVVVWAQRLHFVHSIKVEEIGSEQSEAKHKQRRTRPTTSDWNWMEILCVHVVYYLELT